MTTTRPARSPRLAAPRGALSVVLAGTPAVWLAACLSIPTVRPISRGSPAPTEPVIPIPLPLGPQDGASQEDIVAGFLSAAQAGVWEDYETAQEYLARGAQWDPWAQTIVASRDPEVTRVQDGEVRVTVVSAATVDAFGVYEEAVADAAPVEMAFGLVREGGEWRIASLPDGIVVRTSSFTSAYSPVPVYFAAPDGRTGVAEVRWLPTRDLLRRTVRSLLAGPSPWLRDAVVTAIPPLERNPVEDVVGPDASGVVTVRLAPEVHRTELAGNARELLQAQLEATLKTSTLRGIVVTAVHVTSSGDVPWEVDQARFVPLARDVFADAGPFVIHEDRVVEVRAQGVLQPVSGLPSLEDLEAPHHPATGLRGGPWVVLDGPGRLVLLPTDGEPPRTLHTGADLVAPSVDSSGWAWTGERTANPGALVAVSADGEVVELVAPWLEGRELRSVRVARDGTRVAVASVGPDGAVGIEVRAVIRTDGHPQLLGQEGLTVGSVFADVTDLSWLDGTRLAVLGTRVDSEQPGVHEVPLGGATALVQFVPEDARGIAAGRGEGSVFVVDGEGVLRVLRGSSWVVVAEGVADPAFPG